jgi:DNA-nicking Smr family endonuclease
MKDRKVTVEEKELWFRLTQSIKSIKNHQASSDILTPKPVKERKVIQTTPPIFLNKKSNSQDPQLDKSTAKKLKNGLIDIDSILDLHGLSQELAYKQFLNFIKNSEINNCRCLLVITGKGGESQKGILRQMLPLWANNLKPDPILRCIQASQKHGGTGAYYIYLKRKRVTK